MLQRSPVTSTKSTAEALISATAARSSESDSPRGVTCTSVRKAKLSSAARGATWRGARRACTPEHNSRAAASSSAIFCFIYGIFFPQDSQFPADGQPCGTKKRTVPQGNSPHHLIKKLTFPVSGRASRPRTMPNAEKDRRRRTCPDRARVKKGTEKPILPFRQRPKTSLSSCISASLIPVGTNPIERADS